MTKKRIFWLVALATMAVGGAVAQQGGFRDAQGGFTGQAIVTSVEDAHRLRDDSPVVMRGRITGYLGNDRYLFTDNSGTITVKIKARNWGGLSVGENDMVEISGEVDRGRRGVEIEVKAVRKI
ncbi:MAG: NirD/YgiW/YdeI family stress tolerance protein [Treponema sp.]|nr:NirD/YgiW/YdeI family stress tolerance protein [Treponema sp.]